MERVVATRKNLELCPQEALDRQWPCPLATWLSSEPARPLHVACAPLSTLSSQPLGRQSGCRP